VTPASSACCSSGLSCSSSSSWLAGTLDKDTANGMFLGLEHEAGVTHCYLRGFHGFRRRVVDILVEAGATTPEEIQAAGSWTSLRTPL
jgi:hypothetical protein